MAHDAASSESPGSGSSKKRPRSPPPPPPPASRSAEALLSEAQALIEKEDPEDVDTIIALLEGCIEAAAAAAAEGTEEEEDEEEGVTELAVVRSMAHTWLAKIREQQDMDDEEDGDGPADDLGGPALADALAHYEAALACWPENATAAYALAVRRSSRLTTEAELATYERLLRTAVEHAPEEDEETRRMAMEDLALLLLQRGDSGEADGLLRGQLGFMHRLSTAVLSYTLETSLPATAALGPDARPFLRVFDNALAPPAFAAMQEAFSPQSPFWKEHGYWRAEEQGYFSFLCDLQGITSTGCPAPRLAIEAVILQALFPLAVQAFPEVAQATTAEWWAHCRRHASAHQLHFDSLDEGRGYVQHPIASCILYLTGNGVGGPTLMTDQTLLGWGEGGTGLATQGWFCHAKPNRVCAFDAKNLHGVVPGRGLPPANTDDQQWRITFMVGFWRKRVQPKPLAAGRRRGASMDLSPLLRQQPPAAWVAQGRRQLGELLSVGSSSLVGEGVKEACGGLEGPLPCVWEALVGESEMGREELEGEARPPRYDECFQGF